jgi:hypothetical protein
MRREEKYLLQFTSSSFTLAWFNGYLKLGSERVMAGEQRVANGGPNPPDNN